MPYQLLGALLASLLVLATGCDFLDPGDSVEDDQRALVEEGQQQWERQEIDSYRMTYRQEVGTTAVDTVVIEVQDGAFESFQASEPIDADELIVRTVDAFFDHIDRQIGNDDVLNLSVNFEDSLGYPVEYAAARDERDNELVETFELDVTPNEAD